MRPRLAARAFNSPEYVFELKWDGIRALAARDGNGLRVMDRAGGDLLGAVPELRDLRLPEGMVVDGEIVVCDSRGRPSYDLLAGRLGPKAAKRGRGPIFVAFDLVYAEGRPLISRPLAERRARLLGAGIGSRILAVPEHLDDDGEPFLEVVAEYGLEGIVAKRRDGRYVPGTRTSDWLNCHVTPRATRTCRPSLANGSMWRPVILRPSPRHSRRRSPCAMAFASCVRVWSPSSSTPDSRTESCATRDSAVCDSTDTWMIAAVTSRWRSRPTRHTRHAIGPDSSF